MKKKYPYFSDFFNSLIGKGDEYAIQIIDEDDYGDPRPQPYEEFIITESPPCE